MLLAENSEKVHGCSKVGLSARVRGVAPKGQVKAGGLVQPGDYILGLEPVHDRRPHTAEGGRHQFTTDASYDETVEMLKKVPRPFRMLMARAPRRTIDGFVFPVGGAGASHGAVAATCTMLTEYFQLPPGSATHAEVDSAEVDWAAKSKRREKK
jgi:hypothetical protein